MATLFLLLSAALVGAEVFPNYPAGDVLNSGSKCRIAWSGDKDSTTTWKQMSIQFMTGADLTMRHITTVATQLDGTKDGSYEWICPEVTPNAAIYFYQFTSPKSKNTQWTTRFTIASKDGKTVEPPNKTQPSSGKPPGWGDGALKDPSKAKPAPVYSTTTTTVTPTTTIKPGPTPVNVAEGVKKGCTTFAVRKDWFCADLARYQITAAQFQAWNRDGVCERLENDKAYCIANPTIKSSPTTTTSPTKAAVVPTSAAPGVKAGCTAFYVRKDGLLCDGIATKFSITVAQFQSWNRENVCSLLEEGKAYCVGHSSSTTNPPPAASTPTNAVKSAIPGCSKFVTRQAAQFCDSITTANKITVAQFEVWNGAGACNRLESGVAYCIANAAKANEPKTTTTASAAPSGPTPTNVADGVKAGCTKFWTRVDYLLCDTIVEKQKITLKDFKAWNRDRVCELLEDGKAYCVANSGIKARELDEDEDITSIIAAAKENEEDIHIPAVVAAATDDEEDSDIASIIAAATNNEDGIHIPSVVAAATGDEEDEEWEEDPLTPEEDQMIEEALEAGLEFGVSEPEDGDEDESDSPDSESLLEFIDQIAAENPGSSITISDPDDIQYIEKALGLGTATGEGVTDIEIITVEGEEPTIGPDGVPVLPDRIAAIANGSLDVSSEANTSLLPAAAIALPSSNFTAPVPGTAPSPTLL